MLRFIILLFLLSTLLACGQSGKLYLVDQKTETLTVADTYPNPD